LARHSKMILVGLVGLVGLFALVALLVTTRVREEFVDLGAIPEPHALIKQVRTLMDKYDKPEVWNHAAQVMDKDPGELARMHLGISN